MKKCATNVGKVDVTPLGSCCPEDPSPSWLVTSMGTNREYSHPCYFLSIQNDWEKCIRTIKMYSIGWLLWHSFFPVLRRSLPCPPCKFITFVAICNLLRNTAAIRACCAVGCWTMMIIMIRVGDIV